MPPRDSSTAEPVHADAPRPEGVSGAERHDTAQAAPCAIPAYLSDTYTWAYLSRAGCAIFDRQAVVSTILWGNARRLISGVTAELRPGDRVWQPACVYGSFSSDVAAAIGPTGHLEVTDIAPIQVALTRRKLADVAQANVEQWDAAIPPRASFDAVTCFFLLHEVPEDYKHRIVDAVLAAVAPGGKAVFVDYHRPAAGHPLGPIMAGVFAALEPFARTLWDHEIATYATHRDAFTWRKETVFGGLYQKVVAQAH